MLLNKSSLLPKVFLIVAAKTHGARFAVTFHANVALIWGASDGVKRSDT
jgi:hypothetical protein